MIIIPNLKILSKSFNSSDVDENILITYTICAVCATFLSLLICKKNYIIYYYYYFIILEIKIGKKKRQRLKLVFLFGVQILQY